MLCIQNIIKKIILLFYKSTLREVIGPLSDEAWLIKQVSCVSWLGK